ncbi:NAD-dependent epimerase/dehydratase family protein [Candidatus Dojkabacteria bacterium]|nr:NAD-dependent epimerase/dehydratase family protein [Candidatus Dojkabacteria bacterium]
MNILVTGAAGFIGSFLTRELLRRGDYVVGLDNFSDYYKREAKEFNLDLIYRYIGESSKYFQKEEVDQVLSKLNDYREDTDKVQKQGSFKFYELDIRDKDGVQELFEKEKIDSIIHLAAAAGVPYSLKKPILYTTTNIDGTAILLENAARNEIKRFVFASSSSVYGKTEKVPTDESYKVNKPVSVYAATKRMGELLCYTYNHIYGTEIICARIFGPIYGPLQRPYGMAAQKFIRQVDHDLPITIYGDGTMKRDCTYIDDEVRGLILCNDADMTNWQSEVPGYEIINVGGTGDPTSVQDMADLTIKHMGKGRIEYTECPPTEVPITCADTSKAQKLLGYKSQVDYEEGITRQIEVYKLMPDWYKQLVITRK